MKISFCPGGSGVLEHEGEFRTLTRIQMQMLMQFVSVALYWNDYKSVDHWLMRAWGEGTPTTGPGGEFP